MKIPIYIAEKLLQLLKGESVPSSSANHSLIDDLVFEGIVERKGRIQKSLFVSDSKALITYLQNKFSISDLQHYISTISKEDITRTELISATSDSKHRSVRSFKGFLVNSFTPIQAELNGKQITINSDDGSFQFIYDYEKFTVSPDITIVGIENPANFRHINKQRYLFADLKPMFVSRYPQNQSKDLIKWLQTIPNNYLHFGDFDFAGIGIYLNEFKKHLADKASFLVPENIDNLTQEFGNRKRYDNQKINFDIQTISEIKLLKLIDIIHKWKKGLDQEILIRV